MEKNKKQEMEKKEVRGKIKQRSGKTYRRRRTLISGFEALRLVVYWEYEEKWGGKVRK
jgi:hypothetical protein